MGSLRSFVEPDLQLYKLVFFLNLSLLTNVVDASQHVCVWMQASVNSLLATSPQNLTLNSKLKITTLNPICVDS